MLPDFSEYNWVIPDFVWELSEHFDLGKCSRGLVNVKFLTFFLLYMIFLINRQTSQSFTGDGGNSQTTARPRQDSREFQFFQKSSVIW